VYATMKYPDGAEHCVPYDFLVGTDGARGVVRKALGLTFLGETRNVDNMTVGDVKVEGLDGEHWHMWGELGTAWLSLRPTEVPSLFNFLLAGNDVNHAALAANPDAVRKFFADYTGDRKDLKFKELVWLSHYRPNIRMADKFGDGRVFVAGDSAHVHSPTGGQGLNTGIQDSFNLGWKLALVQRNLAPFSLLDSYTEERLPVVAEMLKQTTALLNRTFRSKQDDTSVFGGNGALLQLGVNYRWSSIIVDEQREEDDVLEGIEEEDDLVDDAYGIQNTGQQISAGDRAPDAPGMVDVNSKNAPARSLFDIFGSSYHTVLIFSDMGNHCLPVIRALRAYPQSTVRSVIIIPPGGRIPLEVDGADWVLQDSDGHAYSAYPIDTACHLVIVRPDGVIGAVVRGREGMEHYFQRILRRVRLH